MCIKHRTCGRTKLFCQLLQSRYHWHCDEKCTVLLSCNSKSVFQGGSKHTHMPREAGNSSLIRSCVQTGFMSTTKKSSIFSVPDGPGGKVGVVGSGKPMTQEPTRPRHDFAAGGT